MISVYKIKPAFQKVLQPILRSLHKRGVTPNQLTILAILLSLFLGYQLLNYDQIPYGLLILPLGLLLRMALNALDGMMARQYDMQSTLGEMLNEMGDIISDMALILPLLVIPNVNKSLIIGFAILTILNEFAGLLGKAIGKERRYDGPMGKSDRSLVIGLFCLVWFFWSNITDYADYIFCAVNALILISTFIRLKKSL